MDWNECNHEWKEVDGMGGKSGYSDVECVHCGVPGERNDNTGEVYWPAT